MKVGPSSEVHCNPCLFEQVQEENVSMQTQLAEAQMVKLFAVRIVEKIESDLPAPEKITPIAYQRHQAAASCAKTILKGDCSFYVYLDDGDYRKLQRRPPELEGFKGLKSV
jgi:hypothetical protein